MPCDSRVTATQMTDQKRLEEALAALGYEVTERTEYQVEGARADGFLGFRRGRLGAAFIFGGSSTERLREVQRKYSEIGVRAWAKAKGFSVAQVEGGRKFTLVNRRG